MAEQKWKEKNKRKRDYRGKKKVGLTGYYRKKGGRIYDNFLRF